MMSEKGTMLESEGMDIVCRREVIEFGQVPIYPWLNHISSMNDILKVKENFLASIKTNNCGNGICT